MDILKNGIEKIKNLIEKSEIDQAKDYIYNSLDKFKLYYLNFKKEFKMDFEKCKKGDLQDYDRDFLWFFFFRHFTI